MQVWLRSSSVSCRTCRSCALLSVYLLLAHVACRLAHLILLHFLGLSIAAALALVVGEVAVLAVGHLVSADRSTFSNGKKSQSSSVKLESKSGCAATTTRRAQQERLMHSTEAGSNNPVSSCSQSLNNELRGSSLPASTRGSRFNPDLWWINMNISLFLPLWWFFAYSRGTARFRKAAQKLSRGFAQWVGKRWRGATPPCFENTFVSSIYQTSKVKNKQINHKYQKYTYMYIKVN